MANVTYPRQFDFRSCEVPRSWEGLPLSSIRILVPNGGKGQSIPPAPLNPLEIVPAGDYGDATLRLSLWVYAGIRTDVLSTKCPTQ